MDKILGSKKVMERTEQDCWQNECDRQQPVVMPVFRWGINQVKNKVPHILIFRLNMFLPRQINHI
jgi:hypothetical protein